jgi:type I restriction enzyme, S subunit
MTRYDKYKVSAVEWIGEIPNEWEIKGLKYISEVTLGKMLCPEDKGGYLLKPYLKSKNIGRGKLILSVVDEMWFSPSELNTYRLEKDDILLSEGGEVGKTASWNNELDECYIQNSVHRIRINKKHCNRYFFYYLTHLEGSGYYKSVVNQVSIAHLTKEKLVRVPCIIPGELEQYTIASHLDRKTVQIDQVIRQKEFLLEKLQAKRQAIINEAATKGVNSSVSLKPSGIEWLGDIPKHWKIKKLKHLITKVGSGVTPRGGAEVYVDNGIPLLRSQNIYNDGLRLTDVAYITESIHNDMNGSRVLEGDVLLNITGASIGRCYYYDGSLGEANVNQHVCIIRPIQDSIRTEYLHRVLCSVIGQVQIDILQTGANREGLNGIQLKSFVIPLPSIKEQEDIVKQTDKKLGEIQKVENLLGVQIEKLKTYRQSLITEVVTGKIKVV